MARQRPLRLAINSNWKSIKFVLLFCVLFVLVLYLAVACGILGGFNPDRPPDKYLIPSGYTGWVIVERGVTGAPPTPFVGGYKVYAIKPGHKKEAGVRFAYFKTVTREQNGYGEITYYYVTNKGLTPIHDSDAPINDTFTGIASRGHGYFSSDWPIPETEVFFIGTKSDYDRAFNLTRPKSEEEEAQESAREAQDKIEEAKEKAQDKAQNTVK